MRTIDAQWGARRYGPLTLCPDPERSGTLLLALGDQGAALRLTTVQWRDFVTAVLADPPGRMNEPGC